MTSKSLVYTSTRGGDVRHSFEKALTTGYAPDGGLYVPEELPKVSNDTLEAWSHLGYRELACEVMGLFLGDEVEKEDLKKVVYNAFKNFPEEAVTLLDTKDGFKIAELWRGPTHCFKDLSMGILMGLLNVFNGKRGKKTTILAATTGDTGPAAVHAVKAVNSPNMKCYVFYPHGQVSETQKLQMTTNRSDHVKVSAFEGGGDDMDIPIKQIQSDKDFVEKHGVMGCNSYNICRPVAQTIHFFWIYFQYFKSIKIEKPWENPDSNTLHLTIPVGAMGNIAGGFIAKIMGLPLGRFTAAVNINDITHRAISKGEYHKSDEMLRTVSEAINIQNPYNFERLMYYSFGCDTGKVREIMTEMDQKGKVTLSESCIKSLQNSFSSNSVTDAETLEAIRTFKNRNNSLICPHTAVAYHTALTHQAPGPHLCVVSTASPCKFSEAVTSAVGSEVWGEYEGSGEFPVSARYTVEEKKDEKMEFTRLADGGLPASQAKWEAMLREKIENW
eukprot:TRINITY_DN303_c0_g1_i1.p1 TRINITY_DN303_c0_g1~~TRINITY_DN303_c0_g1_i1.p1  ORF type:complete len:500 (+),score=89.07 TRINITY_DN303_c0_g1_i1:52-1551(+)